MYLLEIRSEIRKWVIRTAGRQRRCWGLRKGCLITVYTVSRKWAIFCTDTLTECDIWILQSVQDPPQRDEWLMSDTGWSFYKEIVLTHPPVLNFINISLVSSEIVTCGETGWYGYIEANFRTFAPPYWEWIWKGKKWNRLINVPGKQLWEIFFITDNGRNNSYSKANYPFQ
jgi:hypothetical protein